jgi:hypothetical protein
MRRPQAAAGRHRRGEAHAVQPVVHAHPCVSNLQRRFKEFRQQRQREEAVRNGRAERPGLGPLLVDVDPLVVAGRLGEQVDLLLRDR